MTVTIMTRFSSLSENKDKAWIATGVVSSTIALYSIIRIVRRISQWKEKDRLARESGLPYLPVPEGDSVFVGHISSMRRNWDRVLEWRLDGFKEAGGALTFCRAAPMWLPNPPISTCDPAVVKHILKDQFNKYIKTDPNATRILHDLLGDGIFVVDHGTHAADEGAAWTLQRKVASNIFTRSTFRGYMSDVFARHSLVLGKVMEEELQQSNVIDMQPLMFKTTLDVIGEIGFGCHLDSLPNKEPPAFAVAFDNGQVLSAHRIISPGWDIPLLGKLLYRTERELARHIKTLDNFAYKVIRERRKELVEAGTENKQQDILSLFLAEKLGLSEKLLRDIVMSFMIAGRDTTACTLSFMLLLFAQNPEKQELARAEVRHVLGNRPVAAFEDVGQMSYLNACVQECLRLYPPVPSDSKICAEADVLPNGGKVFPGQRISFEPYCMGRLSPLWKNDEPDAFKPERWLKLDKLPSAYEFPVFQAGPRVCLGQNFAMLESQVVLSFLLGQGYRFTVIPGRTYTYAPGITISVKNGLPLRVDKI